MSNLVKRSYIPGAYTFGKYDPIERGMDLPIIPLTTKMRETSIERRKGIRFDIGMSLCRKRENNNCKALSMTPWKKLWQNIKILTKIISISSLSVESVQKKNLCQFHASLRS